MDQTMPLHSIINHVNRQAIKIEVLCNAFVYSFSWSSSTPLYWATHYLIYSSCWNFYRSSHHMSKLPKTEIYHLFQNRCYPTFSLMHLFLILSFLMSPLIQCNILIFETLSLFSYWLYSAQLLVSYNIKGINSCVV